MLNFKEETIIKINDTNHDLSDVMFIGTSDGKYRMDMRFFLLISDFDYDENYGKNIISRNLIVYFKDKTFMTRGIFNGSEWWEYAVPKVFEENDDFIKSHDLYLIKENELISNNYLREMGKFKISK